MADQRHAIIFVPGVGQDWMDQSVGAVSERLAAAIKTWGRLEDVRVIVLGGALNLGEVNADHASIERLIGGQWAKILDVYAVNYVPTFVEGFQFASSVERALRALVVIFRSLPQAGNIVKSDAKGRLDKAQALLLSVLVLFLVTYLIYWLCVAISAGSIALHFLQKDPTFAGILPKLGAWAAARLLGRFDLKLVFLISSALAAVIGVVGLAWGSFFARLERTAIEYYAMCCYIRDERPFAACHQLVRQAVESVRALGFDAVDMVSFSLGCLVTGDAIWPKHAGLRTSPEPMQSWVSIGYPFDLVRAAEPEYFNGRSAPTLTIEKWWNVTEPDDFLGSNFRLDEAAEDPDQASGVWCAGGSARPTKNVFFTPDLGGKALGWRRRRASSS